ncbi:MAG TPA: aminotransferase class I/II-fold pyridoxal phosphate-dependent enzyme [bacterium]|nr:aminotransferase class I/II-fold pyridoxal phosphate-dependent enzyme [bacterium]
MFANSHKTGRIFHEMIIQNNREAKERAARGEDVINGSIGSFTHEGRLVTFDSVDSLFPLLDMQRVSAYAPIAGHPDFLEAMEHLCFQKYTPDKRRVSVAVTGGLGGVRQAVANYTELHGTFITADWHWLPYETIAFENHRSLTLFRLFKEGNFDLEHFSQTLTEAARRDGCVFVILNSPAHNPTGYSIPLHTWDAIVEILNGFQCPVILLLDMAYIDFCKPDEKAVFLKIDSLNPNVLTLVNYSISKTLAKYGLRTAVLTAVHDDQVVLDEFRNILMISNRGTTGAAPAVGQALAAVLVKDKPRLRNYYKEKEHWIQVLNKRAVTFRKEIRPELLMPYDSGFFMSVDSDRPMEHNEMLKKEGIYLVPMARGLRLAICSVDKEKLQRVAEVLNRLL